MLVIFNLKILLCSSDCEASAVREHALRVYVNDLRFREPHERIVLTDINLSKAALYDLDLSQITFNYGTFNNTTFTRTNLYDSQFNSGSLENVKFSGSNLTEARIEGVNIKGTVFALSCLHSTKIFTDGDNVLDFKQIVMSDLSGFDTNNKTFMTALSEHQRAMAAISQRQGPVPLSIFVEMQTSLEESLGCKAHFPLNQ